MRTLKNYKFEILLFLATFSILGIFFLSISGALRPRPSNVTIKSNASTPSSDKSAEVAAKVTLSERLSEGTQSLLPNPSGSKVQGIAAYAAGDYAVAIANLETALEENRNDPEAFIYLNNARIGNQTAHTLAVIAPIGDTSEIGLEILRGAGQAQYELNQLVGDDGVPIKLLIANDNNDPSIAKSVAAELVNRSEVLGVLGHYSSGVTLAAAPVYNQGQLPMVSAISTSVELSGLSPYIFRTVPSDSFAAAALARYMINGLNAQKAVLYYDSNSAYSLSLKSEFTTSVFSDGGEIINEYDLAGTAFDADTQIAIALEQGVDVVMLASSTDTLDPSLAVMAAINNEIPLIGGDDLYHPRVLQDGGVDAEGLVVAVPWHVLSDPNSAFVTEAQQIWGGDVSWRSAMAYDAIAALGAALLEDPSREGIRNTLYGADFSADGATGEVHFLPSGDRNRAAQLVQIQAGERSGLGFDFIPID
ncbi:amino acid amide abc transporter substrate-binding haat family [Leptolyngbya sp. Heron Island J]|uniref:ABC transporter substrate-binding protein n=1 Tax=Leptolyngbya sp. Heron Island J TaxID=1385935 RepID=UPI0003B9488E|nr:ABC transporter substrate-binding protein [Leptolyngbya sp. Heron Island J]ESA36681.1 amino acid amide abc transporter substrate-binding haat family [Leptolyngbya sp. Heron Island J]